MKFISIFCFFFLPFLCLSIKLEHTELKHKVDVDCLTNPPPNFQDSTLANCIFKLASKTYRGIKLLGAGSYGNVLEVKEDKNSQSKSYALKITKSLKEYEVCTPLLKTGAVCDHVMQKNQKKARPF